MSCIRPRIRKGTAWAAGTRSGAVFQYVSIPPDDAFKNESLKCLNPAFPMQPLMDIGVLHPPMVLLFENLAGHGLRHFPANGQSYGAGTVLMDYSSMLGR